MPSVLTTPEVLALVKLSRSSVLRMCQRGEFPAAFKLGLRKNGWLRRDIEAWLEARAGVPA